MGKTSIEHILQSHYRAITDINWHPFDPDIVCSTGIDSWIWAWDIRDPSKPAFGSLCCLIRIYIVCSLVYLQAFLLSMVFHLVQCPRLQSSFRLAGGTQVKWNRKDGNILASSHLDEILTWDRRVSGRTKHPTGDLIWCRKDQFRPHA